MIGLAVFIVAFCAMAFAASEPGSEGREAALLGTLIFAPIGLALGVGGAATLYRRDTLHVSGDELRYERRSLFRPLAFSSSLADYACVLPSSAIRGQARREMRLAFYARLVHRDDDARNVVLLVRLLDELGMIGDAGGEREPYERLARSLDLPLATESADGIITLRYPDELDLSIGERAEAAGERAYEPGPERPFPTRRYRVRVEPDGFSAERGYPVYLLPFVGLATASVLVLFVLPLPADPWGSIGLVLGAFSLFMLAFSLTRARLEVRGGSITVTHSVAGIIVIRQAASLARVEEVTVAKDPRYNGRALRVASDEATLTWAAGASPEELAWFKDEIHRRLGLAAKNTQ